MKTNNSPKHIPLYERIPLFGILLVVGIVVVILIAFAIFRLLSPNRNPMEEQLLETSWRSVHADGEDELVFLRRHARMGNTGMFISSRNSQDDEVFMTMIYWEVQGDNLVFTYFCSFNRINRTREVGFVKTDDYIIFDEGTHELLRIRGTGHAMWPVYGGTWVRVED